MKQEQRQRLSLLEGGRWEEPGSCSNRQKSPSLGPLPHTNPLPSVSLPPPPTSYPTTTIYLYYDDDIDDDDEDVVSVGDDDDDDDVFPTATASITHSFLIALNGWNTSLQSP